MFQSQSCLFKQIYQRKIVCYRINVFVEFVCACVSFKRNRFEIFSGMSTQISKFICHIQSAQRDNDMLIVLFMISKDEKWIQIITILYRKRKREGEREEEKETKLIKGFFTIVDIPTTLCGQLFYVTSVFSIGFGTLYIFKNLSKYRYVCKLRYF